MTGSFARTIAGVLKDRATHQMLPALAHDIAGFDISDDSQGSKSERILGALDGKSERELAEILRRVGAHFDLYDLEETALAALEERQPPITEITRRDVAKCFGDDLSGARSLLPLLQSLFPIDRLTELFTERTLAEEIERHMIRNPGDWDVEYLFERIGAFSCSRDRFARLLEASLHPLARRGVSQTALVDAINPILRRDGYVLEPTGEQSGHPIVHLAQIARGVVGTPKNIIFASNGAKPELGFRDAINNDIVILSNAESCLVYDRSIRRDGLLWSELVDWWEAVEKPPSSDPARSLGRRLRESLASDAERSLFDNYFRLYRPSLGTALPALIPQVYLHYDPAIVKYLRHRATLPRQRMDFLLLLPNQQRAVIEVDGTQHFVRDEKPSLSAYSQMVSADRTLRLAGYEIYRFGANELVGASAAAVIQDFFDRLWIVNKVTSP